MTLAGHGKARIGMAKVWEEVWEKSEITESVSNKSENAEDEAKQGIPFSVFLGFLAWGWT